MSGEQRWPLSVRLLHWLGAAAILFMLALGFVMVNLVSDPGERFDLYQAHKSFGLFVLVLMLGRIALRLTREAQPPLRAAPRWRRNAAGAAHAMLYALTIALSLAGYAMVSSSPLPLPIALPFGFKAPNLLAPDYETSEHFRQMHHMLALGLAICVIIHVAAAVQHEFRHRDGTLRRIGLFLRPARADGAGAHFARLAAFRLYGRTAAAPTPPSPKELP